MTVTPTIDEGYAFIFANSTSSTNPLDLFTPLGKSTAFSLDMENYLSENHLFFIIRSIYKENANSTIACNGTIIDTDNRFPWNLQNPVSLSTFLVNVVPDYYYIIYIYKKKGIVRP